MERCTASRLHDSCTCKSLANNARHVAAARARRQRSRGIAQSTNPILLIIALYPVPCCLLSQTHTNQSDRPALCIVTQCLCSLFPLPFPFREFCGRYNARARGALLCVLLCSALLCSSDPRSRGLCEGAHSRSPRTRSDRAPVITKGIASSPSPILSPLARASTVILYISYFSIP